MEESIYKKLEQRKMKEVASEYLKNGWEVIISPNPRQLPKFLENFSPDIIANKGQENVVIEIKSKFSMHDSEYMIELAKVLEGYDNWKLDLVITNPKKEQFEIPRTEFNTIEEKFSECKKLIENESYEAAFLLSWGVLESSSRLILSLEQPKAQLEMSPSSLFKQLFSYGIIDKIEFDKLYELIDKRNKLVHGYFKFSNKQFKLDAKKIIESIERLLFKSKSHYV